MKFLLALLISTTVLANTPQGNHFSNCHPFGQNDRHSFKMTAYMDRGNFYSAFQMFSDKECQKQALTVIYGSDFDLGLTENGLIEFDHTPTHVFMVLLSEDVVDHYNDPNRPEGCGYKDWEINKPKDVNGLFCHPFQMPRHSETLYDIIKYENSVLQFGGIPFNWNITDPYKRPKDVHQIKFFK